MINPVQIIKNASFVLSWQFMCGVGLAMIFFGAVMTLHHNDSELIAQATSCVVTKVDERGDEIDIVLDCNVGNQTKTVKTSRAAVVLAVIKNNATTLQCDIYVSGRVKNCKIN